MMIQFKVYLLRKFDFPELDNGIWNTFSSSFQPTVASESATQASSVATTATRWPPSTTRRCSEKRSEYFARKFTTRNTEFGWSTGCRPEARFHLANLTVSWLVLQLKVSQTAAEIVVSLGKQSVISVTRLGDLLDFGQLFKAFGNN